VLYVIILYSSTLSFSRITQLLALLALESCMLPFAVGDGEKPTTHTRLLPPFRPKKVSYCCRSDTCLQLSDGSHHEIHRIHRKHLLPCTMQIKHAVNDPKSQPKVARRAMATSNTSLSSSIRSRTVFDTLNFCPIRRNQSISVRLRY